MSVVLVTGPARSGKSEWAERLAEASASRADQQLVYVATARRDPADAEWQARIDKHVQRRSDDWHSIEVPVDLVGAIAQKNSAHCLLIDSLGTWLANLIAQSDEQWQTDQDRLIVALTRTEASVILVAEETGWGVVPAYEMGRTFRDRLGNLSRRVGEISSAVYLVTGGYALNLVELGRPVGGVRGTEDKSAEK